MPYLKTQGCMADRPCYPYTTQKQVRAAFWQGWTPELKRAAGIRRGMKSQNDYPAVVRQEWCEFVDMLARNGEISEELAGRVTL